MPNGQDHDRIIKTEGRIDMICQKLDSIKETLEEIKKSQEKQGDYCKQRGDYNSRNFISTRVFFWIIPLIVFAIISIGSVATHNKIMLDDHIGHYEKLVQKIDEKESFQIDITDYGLDKEEEKID